MLAIMAKTEYVRARIDPQLKREVEAILDELGLTVTQAIILFFKQVQHQNGLPFSVRLPDARTRRAIADAKSGTQLVRFDDPQQLFDETGL